MGGGLAGQRSFQAFTDRPPCTSTIIFSPPGALRNVFSVKQHPGRYVVVSA